MILCSFFGILAGFGGFQNIEEIQRNSWLDRGMITTNEVTPHILDLTSINYVNPPDIVHITLENDLHVLDSGRH